MHFRTMDTPSRDGSSTGCRMFDVELHSSAYSSNQALETCAATSFATPVSPTGFHPRNATGQCPPFVFGKAITSRIFFLPHINAMARSIPSPIPAIGGIP
jgi:hypothetical protein